MNVSTLNTAVIYETLDTVQIRRSLEEMLKHDAEADYAFQQTNYLPSVRDKAKGLYAATIDTRQAVDKVSLILRNDTATALKKLNELRAAAPEMEAEDEREDNLYFRHNTLTSFQKNLQAAMDTLQEPFSVLTGVKFDPSSTTTYKTQLDAALAELNKALAATEEKMEALENSRTILSEAMAVFEKKNLADVAKETLLTAENISALGVAAPEVELIKFAIDHMKKTMENISESLNYYSMYEQRERLITDIKKLMTQIKSKNAEVENTTAKSQLIASVHGVYEQFFTARAEYVKFERSINAFNRHVGTGDPTAYEDRFVAAAPYLIDYLK